MTDPRTRPLKSKMLGLSQPYDWSNSDIDDAVLIRKVLRVGKFDDILKTCIHYGIAEVRKQATFISDDEIRGHCSRQLINIAKGISEASGVPVPPEQLLPITAASGMSADTLRDGIFSLNTRRFGNVAELMVAEIEHLERSGRKHHDLKDDKGTRVEVKFSKVQRANTRSMNRHNLLSCIEGDMQSNRRILFGEWQRAKFVCNIQQIKKSEFDVLYYGLFFHDEILIFSMRTNEIDSSIGYCDRQHKGNIGEGQFHIDQTNLQTHIDRHLHMRFGYDELLRLFQPDGQTDKDKTERDGQ